MYSTLTTKVEVASHAIGVRHMKTMKLVALTLIGMTMGVQAFSDPDTNLVLRLAFDADDGVTAIDSSGCGNHGLFDGAGLAADAYGGQAATFDGTDDYVRVPSSASLMPAAVTVAAWVRLDSLPAEVRALVFKRNPNNSNNEAYALQINADGGLRFVLANGWQTRLDSSVTLGVGEWHHVAATFSQPDMKVYVDGALVGSANHDCALSHEATADVFVAAADHAYYPMGSFLPGVMDEVRIYNRALTAQEVADLSGFVPEEPPPETDDLILQYEFDGDDGTTAIDASECANDGSFIGAGLAADTNGGQYATFDGSDDYIRVPASPSLMPTSVTIAAWVRFDSPPAEFAELVFKRNSGDSNNEDYAMQINSAGGVRFVLANGWQTRLDSSATMSAGQWHHVAATFSQPDMKVYVDGLPAGTASHDYALAHDPGTDLLLGAADHKYNPMGPFAAGAMDGVKIFKRALSAAEIADLAGVVPEDPPPATGNLVLHYAFDGDGGLTATDASEYGNDGSFVGAGLAADTNGGQYATFNGTNGYIRVPSSASLMPAAVTVAAWVRFDTLPTEVSELVFKRNPYCANNEDYALQITPCARLRFVLGNGGQTRLDSSVTMGVGEWHHVAATFVQPEMKVYVDGVLAGTASHNYALAHHAGADLLLGAADHSLYPMSSFANGGLDDVRIYDRALTVVEIDELAGIPPAEENPPIEGGDLMLHYAFDAEFESTVADSSEYGNDGVAQGGQFVATGVSGGAASFDGVDDFVRVPGHASLDADDLTISAWVKLETRPDAVQNLVFKRVPGVANGMDYALQLTSSGAVRWTVAGPWQTIVDSPALEMGTWHHVVATFAKPTMNLYLDGLLVGTASHFDNLTKNAATDLIIGAADDQEGVLSAFACCQLDELRLYRRVLTEAEIEALAGTAGQGELVLRYTFDGDGGSTVADSSGYGNTGVLEGALIDENGMIANGAAFDGTDDYIRVSSSDSLMPSELTISAWVRFDSLPQEVAELVFKRNLDVNNNEAYALQIQSSGSLRFVLGNGYQTRLDSAPMGVGEWHHVAATFAQPNMNIYIDGAPAGSAVHDYPLAHNATADLLVGACDHAELPMSSFAHGLLDDIRVYKQALNDQEVAALVEQRIAEGILDAQDADRDGVSNLAERRAGTDPLNGADQMAIQTMTFSTEGAGNMVLRWSSVPGLTYRILWAPSLMSGFVPLASGILATETESAYTNELAGESVANFFRIQLQD